MKKEKKSYSGEFKSKVAVEALGNTQTLAELSGKYGVHPVMISKWKNELLEQSSRIFEDPRKKSIEDKKKEESLDEAHRQIGQLTIERDWLKKKYRQLGGTGGP